MESLKSLVHKLDAEVGSVGCHLEVLSDVQEMFTHLVREMNDKTHNGQAEYYQEEWQRQLRVLSELMRYEMEAFHEDFESASAIKDDVFEKIVKQGENHEKDTRRQPDA